MSWYTDPTVTFRRVGDRIEPVSKSPLTKGSVVFYEVPVRSSGHFTVDVIRYTMQCVYSGEVLFPCSFNTDIGEKTSKNTKLKVFFDHVFNKTFRRKVTDRFATALMDTCEKPFLFKALGAFSRSDSDEFNCLKISYLNGESYLVTTRDIGEGEVLVVSSKNINVPRIDDGFEEQMGAMNQTLMEDLAWYNTALETRGDALKVRPDAEVREVSGNMDKGLEERVRHYGLEREVGFTEIRERMVEMNQEDSDELDTGMLEKMMEEKYNDLMKENFGWEFV